MQFYCAALAFVRDRAFHAMEGVHQSVHVADIHSTIPAGPQRTAGQEVDVGEIEALAEQLFPTVLAVRRGRIGRRTPRSSDCRGRGWLYSGYIQAEEE